MPRTPDRPAKPKSDKSLSLHGLDFESAVRAAMATGKPPKLAVAVKHQIREGKNGRWEVVATKPKSKPKRVAEFDTRQQADDWIVRYLAR